MFASKSTESNRVALSLLLTVGMVGALAGCASGSEPAVSEVGGVSDACAALFVMPAVGDGTRVTVVMDPTASAVALKFDASMKAAIHAAAEKNGSLSILSVDGAGATPNWIGRDLSLNDPSLPSDTPRHTRISEMAPDCAEQLASTAAPSTPGSDILGAVQLAAQPMQSGDTLLVLTDGMSNAGMLDFSKQRYPATPESIVSALESRGQLPKLSGVTVEIAGIGSAVGPALNQVVVEWFLNVYRGLCDASGAAKCSVSAGTGQAAPMRAGLPEDLALPLPQFEAPVVDGSECVFTVGSTVLFPGDSDRLLPAADVALQQLATTLRVAGIQILIEGHTATMGSVETNMRLSQLRADAVLERLISLGVDRATMRAEGKGAEQPRAVPDHNDSGVIDPAASQNRRVVVKVTGLNACQFAE